jgi:hypothetical protein
MTIHQNGLFVQPKYGIEIIPSPPEKGQHEDSL